MNARDKLVPPRNVRPPAALARAAERLAKIGISAGMTTTSEGHWALFVRVPAGVTTPIAEVEQVAAGLPVVYDEDPPMPVARPAFPDRGE